MTTYRVYRLDREGRIFSREDFEFKTETDALLHAMELAGKDAVEVWSGNRKIAHIAETLMPFGYEIEQMRRTGELPRREK